MTIELTDLMAKVLQRMLVDEINNQEEWKLDDQKKGFNHEQIRDKIIQQCEDLRNELEKKGEPKFYYYG